MEGDGRGQGPGERPAHRATCSVQCLQLSAVVSFSISFLSYRLRHRHCPLPSPSPLPIAIAIAVFPGFRIFAAAASLSLLCVRELPVSSYYSPRTWQQLECRALPPASSVFSVPSARRTALGGARRAVTECSALRGGAWKHHLLGPEVRG